MDPIERRQFEESLVNIRETLPRVYWALYTGCQAIGFSQKQAFAIVTTYILSQNPNGIRPDNTYEKEEGE